MASVGPCGFCGVEATLKCAKCRLIFYCNRECQIQDRRQHKNTCVDFYLNKFKPVVAGQSNNVQQASISEGRCLEIFISTLNQNKQHDFISMYPF